MSDSPRELTDSELDFVAGGGPTTGVLIQGNVQQPKHPGGG